MAKSNQHNDYNTDNWQPTSYLEQFYSMNESDSDAWQPFTTWSMAAIKKFIDPTPRGKGRLLDIGTGPVVAYLISAAQKFNQIYTYVTDFPGKNVEQLE